MYINTYLMETIIIAGKILDKCETLTDNNGKEFVRFKVVCIAKKGTPSERITIYRCYFYNPQYSDLKSGETVVIIGELCANIRTDKDGRQWANLDIYVKQINRPSIQ